jgi:hypothetical protein
MKELVRSDPASRDALTFFFRALDSPELARCKTVGDFEDLQAEAEERAPRLFQSKLRHCALREYLSRMWELHQKQVTQCQIYRSLQVDASDFRKYLSGKKFGPYSSVVKRINDLLDGNSLPPGL